ncbi:nucleocapsid protein [Mammarenavirus gairoense]|uniref:Nucleoprotein n=11 Tax=Mammarenavirus gairoense TaxID=3052306 RepID=A0A0B4N5X4_9VIRU|nr:nucleocapsid protein [Mammarenavirus gairoense]AIK25573.1 nucleocapsid protein [Mammarenavirus gairoense]
MSNSKEVKSFLWTQSLRRELSGYCTNTRVQVIKDAQSLLHGLDFSEVNNIQRLMRKEKRDDSDLKRLRDLNQAVNNLVELKSVQQKSILKVGSLTSDDLLVLAADLDRLKAKVRRTERPLTGGVYLGNLTQQQLDQRKALLQLVGMNGGRTSIGNGDGIVRVWDVKNPDLLNNQFGTIPSLTLACLCKQGQEDLNDVVKALTDLGLVYTAKYPNLSDLDKLTQTHPVLGLIDGKKSAINISGYNFSLNAAVKAGASLLDGGNMLETIRVTPKNMDNILKSILKVKRSIGMFISDTPGDRNPYENILYKVCLSGEGWPYIASRTSIMGRAWDNTQVDLSGNAPIADSKTLPPPPSNKAAGALGLSAGLTYSQMMELKDSMMQLDPNAKTWIDIEGRPEDPVEIAIYQPLSGSYVHFYREPTDIKQFRQDAKYSHGIDIQDLFSTQPGLTSAVLENLPRNMVLTCQGADDIKKLLDSQGRRDIKLIDVSMQKADSRKFEHQIWDEYKGLCSMHTGIVVEKKKRGGKEEITPHCALLDCLMFESAIKNSVDINTPRPVLSRDLVFRTSAPRVIL